jgi:hypothetical protein
LTVYATQLIATQNVTQTAMFESLHLNSDLLLSIVYSKAKAHATTKTATLNLCLKSKDDLDALNNVVLALIFKIKQERVNLTPGNIIESLFNFFLFIPPISYNHLLPVSVSISFTFKSLLS